MKLSNYCSHDLKMIIFYRGHAQLIFTRVMARDNFSTVSLVSATPFAVSEDFSETFQLLFPWSCLTAFYHSNGPLSVLAILSVEVLVSCNSSYISQEVLMKLSSYCFHDLKMIIIY